MSPDDTPSDGEAAPAYADDEPAENPDAASSFFPYTWPSWGGAGLGWFRTYGEEVDETEASGDEAHAETDEDLWDEGLLSLLIVTGAILFVFPEPGTSIIGAVLLLIGAIGWLVDAMT